MLLVRVCCITNVTQFYSVKLKIEMIDHIYRKAKAGNFPGEDTNFLPTRSLYLMPRPSMSPVWKENFVIYRTTSTSGP